MSRWLTRYPLRLAMPVALLLLGTLLLGGFWWMHWQQTRDDVLAHARAQAGRSVEQVQGIVAEELARGALPQVQRLIAAVSVDPAIRRILLVTPGGEVLAANRLAWVGRPLATLGGMAGVLDSAAARSALSAQRLEYGEAGDGVILVLAGVLQRAAPGLLRSDETALLVYELDVSDRLAATRALALERALESVLLLVLAALALYFAFFRTLARRSHALDLVLQRIAGGEFGLQPDPDGNDEFSALARRVGWLSTRLAAMRDAVDEREQALRAASASYRALFDNSPDGLVAFGRDGRAVLANQAATRLLGGTATQAIRADALGLPDGVWDAFCTASGGVRELESRLATGCEVELTMINALASEAAVLWCRLHDLTAERAAQTGQRLARRVFEDAGEGIFIADASGQLIDANPSFAAMAGCAPAQLCRETLDALFDPAGLAARVDDSGHWHGQVSFRLGGGRPTPPLHLSLAASLDAQGRLTHYIGLASDITEQVAAERRLQQIADHDALTGLLSRPAFKRELDLRLARSSYGRIAFVDLNRFKQINDALGHSVGDAVLREVAHRLRDALPAGGLAARQGGDEFLLALPEFDDADGSRWAGALAHALEAVIHVEGRYHLNLSCSIGFARWPEDGADADTLIRHADITMYFAKAAGPGRYEVFAPEMRAQMERRARVEAALHEALAAGQFSLFVQPQRALGSGNTCGAELLLRWLHPELGQVSPAEFIPLAEDSGLISVIGAWVLQQGCLLAAAWREQGWRGSVSVNVSALQLRSAPLIEQVDRALLASALPAEALTIELTESVLMDDVDATADVLLALARRGVRVSIDDFGTGYSSLAYLQRLPLHELKIDRAFVSGIGIDGHSEAIIETVLAMAGTLGMETVAEGVETAAQAAFLAKLGCDAIQGYWLARPMPVAEFPRWLAAAPAYSP
ncbi:EAL domain-containing protein [Crenobacter caeni]|uniref:EAL domain-containing protein n=1 Tax=Crenobacter caeni TaxID=2705474 RepID=A0A6B2KSQ4_9NEIS|nr:EAL domain-containing protein [Crenobacter caeni]NDV13275.1 EAL domain-containing protein [Crenobacter caeni]